MGNPRPLIGLLLLAFCASIINAGNLWQEISSRPELSEAKRIIEQDSVMEQELITKSYTAFIPNNNALRWYEGDKSSGLIKYHLANAPYRVQDLPSEINSDQMGNPKLFVSRFPSGKIKGLEGWKDVDYYINNAKITHANINCTADSGYQQVLYIVDQVILPTAPEGPLDSKYFSPDAKMLLSKPQIYGLKDENSINKFSEQVGQLKLMDNFELQGSNTFFIPIDQALNDMIDKQVVHGHIVPDNVLFTRTAVINSEEHPSYAYTDNLKVRVSMEKATSPVDLSEQFYVKSNTMSGDYDHKTETVLARIVHGNIPVRNGVVHLIDRPLMVVASSIMSYLEEEDGQLTLFNELITWDSELTQQLKREKADFTLFAPSNNAFNMVNEERFTRIKLLREKLANFLKLHILPRRLTTDMIIDKSTSQEETLSNRRKLYFDVNDSNPTKSIVSLEGAGANATITTQNIVARNGVIHIIDRILGVPQETVGQKLGTHPMLSYTASLASQDDWVYRLENRDERFTLFAPSNDAWDYIKQTIPSTHKKLFMGFADFAYHVRSILERHMIAGHDYNLDELIAMTNESGTIKGNFREQTLEMARGKIYFQSKLKKVYGESPREYHVEWNGIQARVVRPDVECVNGVVHVIDKVLMMNRDVTVNASPSFNAGCIATLVATVITLASTKLLYYSLVL